MAPQGIDKAIRKITKGRNSYWQILIYGGRNAVMTILLWDNCEAMNIREPNIKTKQMILITF